MFKDPPKNNTWFISKKIEVRESSLHGVGVFAIAPIDKYEIIECAPVLLFHQDTILQLESSMVKRWQTHVLHDYVFGWVDAQVAIAWGYGSLYNHSNDDPNVFYRMHLDLPGIEYIAKRNIEEGEELWIHYRHSERKIDFDIAGGMI